MRKGFLVILAVALVAAMAAPALADVNLNGFVRIKPMISNTKNNPQGGYIFPTAGDQVNGVSASDTTQAFVDQRGRFRFTVGDENVKAVAFFESDFIYGNSAYQNGTRNSGGAFMGDSVQLETKNVYIWFKVPNTSVSVTAGLQGYADPYYGMFIGSAADLAGFRFDAKIEPVALTLAWFKAYEGNTGRADDWDIWVAQAAFSPTKDATLGINFHFLNSGGASPASTAIWIPREFGTLTGNKISTKVYMPGINGAAKVGPVDLSGFFVYQFGDVKGGAATSPLHDKITLEGYAVDLRADLAVGPGKLFIEGIYASGDGSNSDDKYKGVLNGQNMANGASGITRTDMYLLLQNADDITVNQAMAYDVGNGGAGMLHFAAGYTQKLMDKLTGKVGLGWVQADKKRTHDGTDLAATDFMSRLNYVNSKDMGTELNAVLTYNIAKGLDLSLIGAYAWVGDALKAGPTAVATTIKNPDDLYESHFRLNYAF